MIKWLLLIAFACCTAAQQAPYNTPLLQQPVMPNNYGPYNTGSYANMGYGYRFGNGPYALGQPYVNNGNSNYNVQDPYLGQQIGPVINPYPSVDSNYRRPYDNYEPARPFAFGYSVKDIGRDSYGYRNDYSHDTQSDGKTRTGSYRTLLPDGRTQIVSYIADENGYRADVQYVIEQQENVVPLNQLNPAAGVAQQLAPNVYG